MGIAKDNQRGTAAIVIIGILSVLTLLFAYSLQNIYQHNRLIESLDRRQIARQLAEAGLEVAKDTIYSAAQAIPKDLRIQGELHKGTFIVNIKKLEHPSGFEVISIGKCYNFQVTLSSIL